MLASQIRNKDALDQTRMLPSINPLKDLVWSLQTAPKIKTFLWKVLSGVIRVADKIA